MEKILIVGHARHGKDTAAEILRDEFGMTFKSSSETANEIFLFDKLKDKYGYTTLNQCFEDRVNHREEWCDLIEEFNKDKPRRLALEALKDSNCYVGMRSNLVVTDCLYHNVFDLIIWIDASERLPLESPKSMKISKEVADIIIENNETEEVFREKLIRFGKISCLF